MKPEQFDIDPLGSEKSRLDLQIQGLVPKSELGEEQDPFGDESQAGVKYKTMAWW